MLQSLLIIVSVSGLALVAATPPATPAPVSVQEILSKSYDATNTNGNDAKAKAKGKHEHAPKQVLLQTDAVAVAVEVDAAGQTKT